MKAAERCIDIFELKWRRFIPKAMRNTFTDLFSNDSNL